MTQKNYINTGKRSAGCLKSSNSASDGKDMILLQDGDSTYIYRHRDAYMHEMLE
jgi:hypothetical protein